MYRIYVHVEYATLTHMDTQYITFIVAHQYTYRYIRTYIMYGYTYM